MQTYIAITGRRLTPAYLSLDYNPPYDVAFITLKYAHCERGAYDLRAYTQPSVRSSRKEGREERKRRKGKVKREKKKKNGLIRNRGQHVTMTVVISVILTSFEDRCNYAPARIIVNRDTVESTE